ncbi:hypothetical protein OSB04_un000133 [Centaurea solstitialis]|uniref:Reverse transcriptase zinc-binding domain-containing protein n=1 Tax=Centaurea solstitialis TaxID=347529 RepID=A0AA38W2V9_9ASTR|nr:hypothetical protein OSB04_un000133 [Centaurea solstitialis]
MWTACLGRLPTQDHLSIWKENPPDLICSLCECCMDSHDHLFFACPYSKEVWRMIKREVGLHGFPESWASIMDLLNQGRGPVKLVQRLALAATVYFLWVERNTRLFKKTKKVGMQIFKEIRSVIMERMAHRRLFFKRVYESLTLDFTRLCESTLTKSHLYIKSHIPKHSFCMWTACLGRLPTQDHLSIWKENPPDLICLLCECCMDSHDHLFFACPYSKEVWRMIKREVGLHGFPESWASIMDLLNQGRGPVKLVQRLALAATVYFLWVERNTRLFKKTKKVGMQIFKEIRSVIMERMAHRSTVLKMIG